MNFEIDHSAEYRLAKDFDLANPPEDFFENPFGYYQTLRDHDPIHKNADGSVLLSRYEDVKAVWRDPSMTVDKADLFRSRFGEGPLLEFHNTHMLFRDPPDHDRLRAIITPFFTIKSIDSYRIAIEKIVQRLLDRLADMREVDFVSDFAFIIPTEVICEIVGIPFENGEYLHDLGEQIVNPLNPNPPSSEIEAGHIAAKKLRDYILPHVNHARSQKELDPSKNLINALVANERTNKNITENEIIDTCVLMFVGGHGTTMNMMSASVFYLLQYPQQLADFYNKSKRIDLCIDELFRFVSPVQLNGRRTTGETILPSGVVEANTEIVLCIGSANRDERIFHQPNVLDFDRKPITNFAFGTGIHFCIGRPLANLTLRCALPAFFDRFRNIERAGEANFRKLPRFRSLDQLPLRLV